MPEFSDPSIEEMLAEPIVRALMTADGVRADELEALLRSIAKRLQAGAPNTSEDSTGN
jgi:hypothetical protein